MRILDKFRSQPQWQSEDPAVRAAAVRDLSHVDNEQELLVEIARRDDDPSVRLEAVLRLKEVDALVSVVRDEPDTMVRGEAEGVLRDLVIAAEDTSIGERGLIAVSNERDLVAVARSARLESVSRLALSRLTDPRALASVARRAERAEIAKEALSKLDDPEEILAVALKSEDKAIALGALERLTAGHLTREILEQLGKQARQKAVQRRARAALAALEEALPEQAPDSEHVAVCEALEVMGAETDLDRGRAELDRLAVKWSALDATSDPNLLNRFAAARDRAEVRLAAIESAQGADRRIETVRSQAIADRDAMCRRLESLSAPIPGETTQQLREEWEALPGDADSDAAGNAPSMSAEFTALEQRFERALAAVEQRQRRLSELQVRLTEVERVIAEMEALSVAEGASSAERWVQLEHDLEHYLGQEADRSWDRLVMSGAGQDHTDAVAALRRRYDAISGARKALFAEVKAEQERAARENLTRVLQRSRTVEGLVSSDKLSLAEAERQLRSIRRLIDKPGPLPLVDRESVFRKLRRAQTGLLGRVRELREFADWQRWANLGIQEELCRRMAALAETPEGDEAELAGRFREIMAKWRQASDVPKDRGAELYERFKVAHDAVHPRCQKFFEAQDALRDHNLARQRAIVEESQRLASSTDWLKTLSRITELQAEWKQLKPVPRREQKELWKRFRDACNTFFSRRKADLVERKKEWSKNLALKEALCERVLGLAELDDVDAAVVAAKKAQAEWKTIGPVRRSRSEALWVRFRAACDTVFERVQARQHADSREQAAVREALCVEAESLVTAPEGSDPPVEDLAEKVRHLQQRWREAPEVPQTFSRTLTARFGQAISRVVETHPEAFRGTDLDPARKLKRLETLCERVEALRAPDALVQGDASPAEILAARWRDALASNLMGARVDEAAERRSALEEVRQARADCRRIGAVAGDEGRRLLARFHAACDAVQSWASPDRSRRSGGGSAAGQAPSAVSRR